MKHVTKHIFIIIKQVSLIFKRNKTKYNAFVHKSTDFAMNSTTKKKD